MQKRNRVRKSPAENILEASIRHVSAPEPEHLWRSAEPSNEIHEVLILREHGHFRVASKVEYLRIVRFSQIEVANVHSFDSEQPSYPGAQARRYLRIEPQNHAATTGWPTRLLAKRRQA